MEIIELKVPDIGGSTDVNVAEVYVKVGDSISKDDNLLMLETDKATMEVPAEQSGVVKEVLVKVGSKVNEGNVIIKLEPTSSNEVAKPVEIIQDSQSKLEPVSVPELVNSKTKPMGGLISTEIIELKVPDIGGSTDVNVAEVYVKVGDSISKDDNLLMLETDKATMEIPAEQSGVVKEVLVKVGSKVNEGNVIIKLEPTGNNELAKPVKSVIVDPPKVEVPKTTTIVASQVTNVAIDEDGFAKAFASPSIRKLARELGANLGKISGSGLKGRIIEDDVKNYVKGILTGQTPLATTGSGIGLDLLPWPKVDFAKFGEIEVKDLSRIKKLSGSNLSRNWVMIPHVTQFDEADITELEDFRKKLNEEYKKTELKVTPLAFLIKACIYALKQFPEFNSSIDADKLVYKKYYHIGFAADTPQGLVVPVLKDADKMGVIEIARETSELARLAREGKLKPNDMQGGTFTISSLGGIGGTAFTPIINAPEVAILGISKSSIKPVWDGKEFQPKLLLPLSLSYDHRIIDGALAAKFTVYLSKLLSDIRRLVL